MKLYFIYVYGSETVGINDCVLFFQEYLESQSQKPVSAPLSLEQALLPAILPSR